MEVNPQKILESQENTPMSDNTPIKCKYCGKEFYPHIVRSYYATRKARRFLKTNKVFKKVDVQRLFISIARKLGHKRYMKNDGIWKECYNVTINHYIQPALVEKIKLSAYN